MKDPDRIPADFPYREVYLKGKPKHDRFDPCRIRHPAMDLVHRAKIFSPFDALRGFQEALAAAGEPDPALFEGREPEEDHPSSG